MENVNCGVTAVEVLNNWDLVKSKLSSNGEVTIEQYNEIVENLSSYLYSNGQYVELTPEQAEQYAKLMQDAPKKVMEGLWNVLVSNWDNSYTKKHNLCMVHSFTKDMMVGIYAKNADQKAVKLPSLDEVKSLMVSM